MTEKPPPLICEKCHRRRLHPVNDKGHRWCKKCRSLEFDKLTGKEKTTPDEKRKLRAGYEYTGVAALLKAIQDGEPGMVRYQSFYLVRFDYTSTHKRQRAKLAAQGRLLPYKADV